ncbi:hypothetical protein [Nocardioides ferulae]|uniref:hypothetical protein n=1 Tax=Nocardioides ferulae TaxID=2340821 RepID=UPI000EB01299|nr:hypothetical protein [Nocardioides ferulae]
MTSTPSGPDDRPTPDRLPTAEESAIDQASPVAAADRSTRPDTDLPRDLEDFRESTPGSAGPQGASGGMGVSSERVGHSGPGQTSTDGFNDTSPAPPAREGAPPEQSTGGPEENPVGLDPKAGYAASDPRSDDKPFQTRGS